MAHLQRTLPFIQTLKRVPNQKKKNILKNLPSFVTDDIIEVLYNILSNNFKVKNSHHRQVLQKNRSKLEHLYSARQNKKNRNKIFYNQSGGFIGSVLPLIVSVIGSIIAAAV